MNAPGIFSCFGPSTRLLSPVGYLGLYVLAAAVGTVLAQKRSSHLSFLLAATLVSAASYWGVSSFVQAASRRMVRREGEP